jgi:hypothetical protein
VASQPHFLAALAAPRPFSTRSFLVAFYPLRAQHLCCGTVKFWGIEGFSPFKIPQLISFFASSLPKLLFILSPVMDPFNVPSTTAAARKIPLLKEAPPTKDLDATREVMCTCLGSTCSKLLWPDLLVGSANLINCRCVTWWRSSAPRGYPRDELPR